MAMAMLVHTPPVSSSSWSPRFIVYEGLRATAIKSAIRSSNAAVSQNAGRYPRVRSQEAKIPLFNFEGERAGHAMLDLRVARAHSARGLVHRCVVWELRNKRRGTACAKRRGEVRGGGRKPYAQKGTGQARRGSNRTPLRRKGGVIFGPKPKDWRIKINKKEKRLAVSTAIMSAVVDTIAVEDFHEQFTVPKTKSFVAAMERLKLGDTEHLLMFTNKLNENLYRSYRNIPNVKVMTPRTMRIYDVLRADKLVYTQSGIEYLNYMYGPTWRERRARGEPAPGAAGAAGDLVVNLDEVEDEDNADEGEEDLEDDEGKILEEGEEEDEAADQEEFDEQSAEEEQGGASS